MSKPRETIVDKYALSAVTIASTNTTQIGEDIPEDKTRYVIGLIISGEAAQKLGVYLGETGNLQGVTKLLIEQDGTNPVTLGSFDPEKPLLVCRPERAAGGVTITKNKLGIAHETSAISVTAIYYDAE